MTKSQQRQEIKQRLSLLSAEEKRTASKQIVVSLEKTFFFQKARTVLFYSAMNSEPNFDPFFKNFFSENSAEKKLALPSLNQAGEIEARQLQRNSILRPHPLGMNEIDPAGATLVAVETIDLILVPGVAFDRKGNRLGRGKGHYDRFLEKLRPQTCRVGCFFACQELDEISVETHDQPLHFILTEKEVIEVCAE